MLLEKEMFYCCNKSQVTCVIPNWQEYEAFKFREGFVVRGLLKSRIRNYKILLLDSGL